MRACSNVSPLAWYWNFMEAPICGCSSRCWEFPCGSRIFAAKLHLHQWPRMQDWNDWWRLGPPLLLFILHSLLPCAGQHVGHPPQKWLWYRWLAAEKSLNRAVLPHTTMDQPGPSRKARRASSQVWEMTAKGERPTWHIVTECREEDTKGAVSLLQRWNKMKSWDATLRGINALCCLCCFNALTVQVQSCAVDCSKLFAISSLRRDHSLYKRSWSGEAGRICYELSCLFTVSFENWMTMNCRNLKFH